MFQESDRSDSNPQIPTPVRSAFLHKFRYRFHRTPSETYLRRSYFVRSAVSEAKTKIMTSSESEEQPQTSRKRSRRSNSGDDGGAGGKKARGRPRVDTQDATAADVSGDVVSFLFFSFCPDSLLLNPTAGWKMRNVHLLSSKRL